MRPWPTPSGRAVTERRSPTDAASRHRERWPLRAAEGAFTLIEVIVTLVILLVVMGMVLMVATNMLTGSRKSVSKKRASGSAQVAMDQLASDIRSMTSRSRVVGGGQTPEDLAFITNPKLLTSASNRTEIIDERVDLVSIGPRLLEFYVPVGDDVQCVRYDAEASGRIVRTVSTACVGASTVISRQVLLDPAPTAEQVAPFSFTMYNPNARCTPVQVGAITVDAATTGAFGMAILNQVATVKIDLRSNVIAGNGVRGTTDLAAEYTMRNRVTDSYLRAIADDCVLS